MNWFKRKTKTTPEVKEVLNFKKEFSIRINGNDIKPLFNNQVSDIIAGEILRLPKQKRIKTKYMSMVHSDICVYVALREGAQKQNLPFNLNMKELFNLIDVEEYVNILTSMKESMGVMPVNSITNN